MENIDVLNTNDKVCIKDLVPLQGELKKRSQKDLDDLTADLLAKGQVSPFIIWEEPSTKLKYILDGHGRYQAYMRMAIADSKILVLPRPAVYIKAKDLAEAKELLLHIDMRYGKMTAGGVQSFIADLPKFDPSTLRLPMPKAVAVKPVNAPAVPEVSTHKIIRIKVPVYQEAQILNILKSCSFIEVV